MIAALPLPHEGGQWRLREEGCFVIGGANHGVKESLNYPPRAASTVPQWYCRWHASNIPRLGASTLLAHAVEPRRALGVRPGSHCRNGGAEHAMCGSFHNGVAQPWYESARVANVGHCHLDARLQALVQHLPEISPCAIVCGGAEVAHFPGASVLRPSRGHSVGDRPSSSSPTKGHLLFEAHLGSWLCRSLQKA